jgi:ribonucleoside-triphosphate reductase
MRNLEVIKQELSAAREALSCVEGTPTEVYSRIVGYYRSVRNWNKGKREEYQERKLFDPLRKTPALVGKETVFSTCETFIERELANQQKEEESSKVLLFVRASCPACPGAKDAAFKLGIPVDLVNADTNDGFAEAAKRQVMSTPTAIFLREDGSELGRARNVGEIKSFAAKLVSLSA